MKKILVKSCWGCKYHDSYYKDHSCSLAGHKRIFGGLDFETWCSKHGYPLWCPLPEDDSDVAAVILGWIREKTVLDLAAFKTHLIRRIKVQYLGEHETARRKKNKKS